VVCLRACLCIGYARLAVCCARVVLVAMPVYLVLHAIVASPVPYLQESVYGIKRLT